MTGTKPRFGRGVLAFATRVPPLVTLSIGYLVVVVAAAIVGNTLVASSASEISAIEVAIGPSTRHLLGTDSLGRDVLARVIAGAHAAILGPLVIAVSGFLVSGLIGILAGYVGGLLDTITQRVVDFFFALPSILLAIVIVAVVQGGYWTAVAVLAVLNVQGDIRLVRSATLAERGLPYVEALRVTGVPAWRVAYLHIGRNILPIMLATFAIDFGGAIVALAGLAFLGLGSQPGTPDWGMMLTEGQKVLFSNPWAALAPGMAIVFLATSVNLIGDWIYDQHAASASRR